MLHTILVAVAFALIGVALATAGYSCIAAVRIARSLRSVPTARAGLALAPGVRDWPSVCIVVPAHNEQSVIAKLVESLVRQDYPNLRIVLSLDRCTDSTLEIARRLTTADARFEIVEISACPEGWAGKCHAAHRGVVGSVSAPGSDLLLFADADTYFDPMCVRATVALLNDRGLDMLSLLSTLTTARWWETIVQPATSLELMRHFPLFRINQTSHGRSFANGQFMLFRRAAYDQIGGHEAVRQELLEDLAFARRLRHARLRGGVLLADRMLMCRMYGAWSDFRRGWKRIFTESAQRRPSRLSRWALELVFTGVVMPVGSLACIGAGFVAFAMEDPPLGRTAIAAGLVGLLAWMSAMGVVHHHQRSPMWTTLAHPIGAWMTVSLLREAARDLRKGKGIAWAGRVYARETR